MPDGSRILFTTGSPGVANSMDVVQRNADGSGAVTGVLVDKNVSEFQHAISPNGQQLCWSEGTGFNDSAELWTGPINVPQQNKVNLSDDKDLGDFNCVWSPEGDEILYVKGAYDKAKLVLAPWPDTDLEREITDDPTTPKPNKFDGNPDWAIDGRPVCPDVTVQTPPGKPVTIPTECTDTGPAYERTPVREGLTGDEPAHGTATDPLKDDSNTSTYTPEPGFTGTDTFRYRGVDDAGFSEGSAVITVNVVVPQQPAGPAGGVGGPDSGPGVVVGGQTPPPPPAVLCAGRVATIVGTGRADTIRGTNRRDVIAARGGNDVVLGRGGNDVICLGAGNDRASGGAGADRIFGGRGRDRLIGGLGRDVLRGGAGRDLQRQ
jgi:hypothetical protein